MSPTIAAKSAIVSIFIFAALFAVSAPAHALLYGVDVSHWQGTINWTSVKADGIEFAFCKATEANSYVDDQFARNMTSARNAGVLIGPYHFARLKDGESDPNDALNEANHFVNTIQSYYSGTGLYLRPVLDLEQIPDDSVAPLTVKQYVSEWARDFCTQVESRLGVKPIIYTGSSFASSYVETDLNQYPLWLANWNYTPPSVPPSSAYYPWRRWAFWQYTSSGSVSGISGNVDRDVYNGTIQQLVQTYAPGFLAGDYNGDNIVDAEDYTEWRDTLGKNVNVGTGADGNVNGVIDAGDFDVWKLHYGAIGSGSVVGLSPATTVPEPAVIGLVAFGVLTFCPLRLRGAARSR